VFGTLPGLGLSLPEFAAYQPEGDPGSHGRFAAGMVMERVFWIVDMIQFVAAPSLLLTMIVQLVAPGARSAPTANLVRLLCALAAAGTLAYQASVLSPAMNRELRASWAAARQGDHAAARLQSDRFQTDHPRATAVFNIRLIALVVAAWASAIALAPRSPHDHSFQAPMLLKRL
jgi:predicted metal-binding membrane protein